MNYYDQIKNELITNEINRRVKNYSINRSDLNTFYYVGKLLAEAGKHYGEGIIKEYSAKLTLDIGKGYGISNLKRMRQFFYMIEKGATMWHQLSWSHYRELIALHDINEINYYINLCIEKNLSVRELHSSILLHAYDRLPTETKNELILKRKNHVTDFVKNPILVQNKSRTDFVSEKVLQKLILEDISNFMKELGNGFCFIGNEYKIKLGDRYNYIDLLLYNYIYKCFVVVELKVTELNSNHTGQIQKYMNYIDKNLKGLDDHKTVGIIICKKNNQYVIDYCSDPRIIAREYQLI